MKLSLADGHAGGDAHLLRSSSEVLGTVYDMPRSRPKEHHNEEPVLVREKRRYREIRCGALSGPKEKAGAIAPAIAPPGLEPGLS